VGFARIPVFGIQATGTLASPTTKVGGIGRKPSVHCDGFPRFYRAACAAPQTNAPLLVRKYTALDVSLRLSVRSAERVGTGRERDAADVLDSRLVCTRLILRLLLQFHLKRIVQFAVISVRFVAGSTDCRIG